MKRALPILILIVAFVAGWTLGKPSEARASVTDPCLDPNTGALDNAQAAGLDLAAGLIWTIEQRATRPQEGEEKVDVLAQGFTRALCFLKTDYQ